MENNFAGKCLCSLGKIEKSFSTKLIDYLIQRVGKNLLYYHFISFQNKNIPKNGQEFVQYWRRYLKSVGDQYTYLLSVGGENLSNIFKTEISFGLLGDIVKALEYHIVDSDVDAVVGILEGLGQTNRFSLSIQFLSSAEKDKMKTLFDKLNSMCGDSHSEMLPRLDSLCEIYELKKK
jgi:hypothetical protein